MTEQELTKIKMAWAQGETVQYLTKGWKDWSKSHYLNVEHYSEWRIKPKTININGHNVPKPLRELKRDQEYYVVDLTDSDLYAPFFCAGSSLERTWLDRGLCHATKEAAIIHARALLSFMEQEQ